MMMGQTSCHCFPSGKEDKSSFEDPQKHTGVRKKHPLLTISHSAPQGGFVIATQCRVPDQMERSQFMPRKAARGRKGEPPHCGRQCKNSAHDFFGDIDIFNVFKTFFLLLMFLGKDLNFHLNSE
jgi:hypothetical protein